MSDPFFDGALLPEEITGGYRAEPLDAVGGAESKIDFVPFNPLATAASFARHCDICSQPSDDLLLACPDCREKSAQFAAVLADEALNRADTERLDALQEDTLTIASLLLASLGKSVREVIDQAINRRKQGGGEIL